MGHPGVAHHARHELAGFFATEEIERLRHQMREELGADVAKHTKAHPREGINIQVGKNATRHHHERDEQADPNDALDTGPVIADSSVEQGAFIRKLQAPTHDGLTSFLDDERNGTVEHPSNNAASDAEEKPLPVGMHVREESQVGLPKSTNQFGEGKLLRFGHISGEITRTRRGWDSKKRLGHAAECVEIPIKNSPSAE